MIFAITLFSLWIVFWIWIYFVLTRGDEWLMFATRVSFAIAVLLLPASCQSYGHWPLNFTDVTLADTLHCPSEPPQGAPSINTTDQTILVCHKGYVALVDEDAKVPLWVAYTLTGPHALGCGGRTNDFHPEEMLPAEARANPKDYTRSGYDRGHQAPAGDFKWDAGEEHDSFSMANMAPQRPGLNREQWQRLEETVRSWAVQFGPLSIYVGPVLGSETIGNGVNVPIGFWKVIVDNNSRILSFYMPNETIPKGDLNPQRTELTNIEKMTNITFPLNGIETFSLWPADIDELEKQRQAACQ